MPDTPPPAHDPENVLQVKRDATARLLAIPGVVAVGIGQKVIGDEHTGEPAIKVFVREKRPPEEVRGDELIPPRIDGVVTDVEVAGDPIPLAAVDQPGWFGDIDNAPRDFTTYRPVVGGSRICPVGSLVGGGTGGCVLWDPANHDVGYVLTNYHVVNKRDVQPIVKGVTKVGQPIGEDSSKKCCNDVIGTFVAGDETADRDEALVRLSPGMKWQATITGIGMVAGKYTLTQADVTVQGSPYKVAKRGQRSGVTGGTISAMRATTGVGEADNKILIKPNTNPGSGTQTVFFGIEGDSGAAVVNGANEVVGLLYARDGSTPPSGIGFAYHIDHVIKRLHDDDGFTVGVATATSTDEVHTVPGATFTEVPAEIAERIAADPAERRAFTGTGNRAPLGRPWFSDVVPAPRTVAGVREDLAGCAAGCELIGLWAAHGEELRGLIGRNRRVTIAWYRGGGAALMQLMLRLPADPSRTLPETLSGVPLMTCVDRLADVLAREGSAGLGDGIRKARALLPDLAGLTYAEIVAALRAKELIPDG